EDGIRDGHVTGVQTCALPIYLERHRGRRARHERAEIEGLTQLRYTRALGRTATDFPQQRSRDRFGILAQLGFFRAIGETLDLLRSEERRVGKECRCGRSSDIQ